MCRCKDVEVGSYANEVMLNVPKHMLPLRDILGDIKDCDYVAVDCCLVSEIKELWLNGISTTGCCCGHNKVPPYIGVTEKDVETMISMGYEVQFNPTRPKDRDSFKPKTI